MFSLIKTVVTSNYKILLCGFLIGIFLPYIKYKNGQESDAAVKTSVEFNSEDEQDTHLIRKRESRADKYLHDFQDYEHPDFLDQNSHFQFPSMRDEKAMDIEELQEQFGNKVEERERIFTATDLLQYNGEEGSPGMYLSILGNVYDVSKGAQHYAPGSSYNFFVGRDASRSFITGEFETVTDEMDHVLTLTPQEIYSLRQWKDFYESDYKYKGKLIGRFYDENGNETPYYRRMTEQIEVAIREREAEVNLENQYPGCNIEWKEASGTRVWCTEKSGGKERDWVGVPRKFYAPGETKYRCACIKDELLGENNIREYEDCDVKATSCSYTVTNDN